jgi:hypothetical protein
MAFTELELATHTLTLEAHFWSLRRPPLHLRERMREGQRFSDQSIELYYVRPVFDRPDTHVECTIAKVTFVRTANVWRIFWMRADGKWHRYPPHPEADSLTAALGIIHKDPNGCFFG